MISLCYLRAGSTLFGQLERRLKKIHEEPRRGVETGERLGYRYAFKASVADHPAHDRAILLLDPCLIVLPVRPTSREFDSVADAIIDHGLVQELAPVVYIQRPERKRQADAHSLQGFD